MRKGASFPCYIQKNIILIKAWEGPKCQCKMYDDIIWPM